MVGLSSEPYQQDETSGLSAIWALEALLAVSALEAGVADVLADDVFDDTVSASARFQAIKAYVVGTRAKVMVVRAWSCAALITS